MKVLLRCTSSVVDKTTVEHILSHFRDAIEQEEQENRERGREEDPNEYIISFENVSRFEDVAAGPFRAFMRQQAIKSISIADVNGATAQDILLAVGGTFFNIRYFLIQNVHGFTSISSSFLTVFRKVTSLLEISLTNIDLPLDLIEQWSTLYGNNSHSVLQKIKLINFELEDSLRCTKLLSRIIENNKNLAEIQIEPRRSSGRIGFKNLGRALSALPCLKQLTLCMIDVERDPLGLAEMFGRESPLRATLKELSMISCDLTCRTVQFLLQWDGFQELSVLDVSENGLLENSEILGLCNRYPNVSATTEADEGDWDYTQQPMF